MDDNKAIYKFLGIYFEFSYKHAATGLPPSVEFSQDNFVRPARTTAVGTALVTTLAGKPEQPVILTAQENSVDFHVPAITHCK